MMANRPGQGQVNWHRVCSLPGAWRPPSAIGILGIPPHTLAFFVESAGLALHAMLTQKRELRESAEPKECKCLRPPPGMALQTKLRFKGFGQPGGERATGGEGSKANRTISIPGNYTAAVFGPSVPLPWPGEWVRASGIQGWDWSRGEASCPFEKGSESSSAGAWG